MKTETRRVAAFRNRLATRQASWVIDAPGPGSWAIDIPAIRRVTLRLTEEQQELLRRETRHRVPSVTLVFYEEKLNPKGHALACLEVGRAAKRTKPQLKARNRAARP